MGSSQSDKQSSKGKGLEKRKYMRRSPAVIPQLKSVRLVAGPEVRLINVSRRGALFETEARLAPRSAVCLRLVTAEAILMLKGNVVRSELAVLKNSAVRYHSAVEFDEDFILADSPLALEQVATIEVPNDKMFGDEGMPKDQPSWQVAHSLGMDRFTDVLLVTVRAQQLGPELLELYGLNVW